MQPEIYGNLRMPVEFLFRLLQTDELDVETLMDMQGWRSDARVYAQCISRYLSLRGRGNESRYWSYVANLLNATPDNFQQTAERLLNDTQENQRNYGETFDAMIADLRAQLGREMWARR